MFALLALLAAGTVHASAANDEKAILHALANASAKLAPKVAPVLSQQQRRISPKCPLGELKPDLVTVLNDVAFNLDGMPERGDWMVHYTSISCGKRVTRSAAFHGGPKGVAIEAAAPGATLADSQLGADVWLAFQKSAVRAKPGCTDMTLVDTDIAEAPSSSAPYWREAWVARVCGAQMGQIVSFYPSPKGTMFRMALPEGTPNKQAAPAYNPPGR